MLVRVISRMSYAISLTINKDCWHFNFKSTKNPEPKTIRQKK